MTFTSIRHSACSFGQEDMTVLDVGGYAGEMARICLDHHAKHAIVIDSGQWRLYGWKEPDRAPGIIYVEQDVMDWHKPADVVLLFNAIYHCPSPYLMLAHLRELTRRYFVICTAFKSGDAPVWYIEDPAEERAAHPEATAHTCFWRPTLAGIERLLDVVGFRIEERFGPVGDHVCYRCVPTTTAAERAGFPVRP